MRSCKNNPEKFTQKIIHTKNTQSSHTKFTQKTHTKKLSMKLQAGQRYQKAHLMQQTTGMIVTEE